MKRGLFQLEEVVITTGARDLIKELGLDQTHYLVRHVTGDWGDLDEHDRQEDETASDSTRYDDSLTPYAPPRIQRSPPPLITTPARCTYLYLLSGDSRAS